MTATTGGIPLANVAITGSPGSLTATTANDGTFSLKNVPIGAYSLTFKRTGYADRTISSVNVAMAGPTSVTTTMDTNAATDGPTIVLQDNYVAGFGQQVTITAQVTASADEDAASLTYSWSQTGGTKATFTGGSTNAIQFTTLTIPSVLAARCTGECATRTATPQPVRFGNLALSPDETGNYSFTLTVTDSQGHTASAAAHVRASWQAPGHNSVPLGMPAYFQGDGVLTADAGSITWNWTLTNPPSGSTATLSDATTQFPHFIPDKAGDYTLTETVSGKSMIVHAGNWTGVMENDSNCTTCHSGAIAPDMFTPWKGTAHYSALHRKLDGQATSHFGPTCMECHTVGDSPIASNAGWDDIASQDNWTFPATLQSGNYDALPTTPGNLKALASIQCESCHGPQYSAHAKPVDPTNPNLDPVALANLRSRVSWTTQVCASCHQEAPSHYKPSQWVTSRHADETLPQQISTVESKNMTAGGAASPQSGAQFCARCHSAQGYARYAKQLMNGATGRYDFLTTDNQKLGANNAPTPAFLSNIGLTSAYVESQTCVACHDPHQNPYPQSGGTTSIDCTVQSNNGDPRCAQLRLYDSVPGLPNGQGAISGVGAGVVCMACHNSRNGEHSDYGPTDPAQGGPPYLETPHDSTATDVLFGFNAYFVARYNPSPHMAVKETCAGCHYQIPTGAQVSLKQSANHSFAVDTSTLCATCHGSNGVNGAALQSQIANEIVGLDANITTHIMTVLKNLNWAGGVNVQVTGVNSACMVTANDGTTQKANCPSSWVAPAVPFPNPPSNVAISQVPTVITRGAGSSNVVLTLATGIAIQPVSPIDGSNVGSPVTLTKLTVPLKSIMVGGNYVFPPSSFTAKAIWNYSLLNNEGSSGLHNFPFTNAVLGATNAALANNPATP